MEDGELVEEEENSGETHVSTPIATKKETKMVEKPKEKDEAKDYIEKKKLELDKKLKSQLASMGVKSQTQVDSDSDADEKSSKSADRSSKRSASSAVDDLKEKVKKSPTPRVYYDYDKTNNPTEEMISNWAKGSSRKSKFDNDNLHTTYDEMDPYADYYGTSGSPVEQLNANSNPTEYRPLISPVGDVDYRNGGSRPYQSGSEDSNSSETSKPLDNAATHGDIDERHSRQANSKRKSSPPRKSADKKRSKRRRSGSGGGSSNGSGSESETDARRRRSDRSRQSDSSRIRSRNAKSSRGSYSPVPPARSSRTGKFERGAGRFVPRVRERDAKDRPICRFYKEGYCREGSTCPYSHACEVVQYPGRFGGKKPELCKYYMNGFCRNEGRCPFYHEDWPCRAFHKGECAKGSDCRYSHSPLTDVTRPLFERMSREDSPPKIDPPEPVIRRKTLLGAPPGPNQPFQPVSMQSGGNFNAMMSQSDQFRPLLNDQMTVGDSMQMGTNGDFNGQQQQQQNFQMNMGGADPSMVALMQQQQNISDGPVAPWHIQPATQQLSTMPQGNNFGMNMPFNSNGSAMPQGNFFNGNNLNVNDFNMQMRPQMGFGQQQFQPQMGMAMGNQFDPQQQQQFFNLQMQQQQQLFNQQQQQMQLAQQQLQQQQNQLQADLGNLDAERSASTDVKSPESSGMPADSAIPPQQKIFDRLRGQRQTDSNSPSDNDRDERKALNSPNQREINPPAFSITDILKQIKQNVSGGQDNVYKPPVPVDPYGRLQKQQQIVRRPGELVEWKFLEVFVPFVSAEDKVPKAVLQLSLTDPKLRNDPRIKRRLDSQFDIGTQQLISQMQQAKVPLPLESPASPQPESTETFPFSSPSTNVGYQPSPQQNVTVGGDPRSVHRDPRLSGKVPVANVPVQQQMPVGLMMGQGQMMPMGNFTLGNMAAQPNMMATGVNGWMPQLAMGAGQMGAAGGNFGASLPDISASQMAQMAQMNQISTGNNNFSRPNSFGRNYESRQFRDEPQLPWAKTQNSSPPADSGSDQTEISSGHQTTVSLREKRKDLQYDSPLAPKEKLAASQYNRMPNVRVKRKTSGSDTSPIPQVPVESPM